MKIWWIYSCLFVRQVSPSDIVYPEIGEEEQDMVNSLLQLHNGIELISDDVTAQKATVTSPADRRKHLITHVQALRSKASR